MARWRRRTSSLTQPALPEPLPGLLTKYWLTEADASIFATRPDPRLLGPSSTAAVTTPQALPPVR